MQVGDEVKVLGESYSLEDQEDSATKRVSRLWIYMSRYRVEVSEVAAGCWCLIEGVDGSLVKTGTITAVEGSDEVCIFRPLTFHIASGTSDEHETRPKAPEAFRRRGSALLALALSLYAPASDVAARACCSLARRGVPGVPQ